MTASRYEDGGDYLAKNPSWHVEDSPWKSARILEMVARHELRPQTVVEVGSGAGELLRLVQRGLPDDVRCVGYDVSPEAHAISSERANQRLEFVCGDFLAARTERFDLLLAIDVFEHVPDYIGFLEGLRDRAEWKLFHIPLDLSVSSVLRSRPILRARREVGHLHYFTRETALATLGDCGYEVVDEQWTASAIEQPRRGLQTRLARLPRRALAAVSRAWAARLLGGFSLLTLTR